MLLLYPQKRLTKMGGPLKSSTKLTLLMIVLTVEMVTDIDTLLENQGQRLQANIQVKTR